MPKGKTPSLHLDFDSKSLELIYSDMTKFADDSSDKQKDTMVERIRQMTEFQIWGEKHNESFFDFFCEKNVLEVMLNILKKAKSKEVIIQIIQSLAMYLTNLKKPININYILSNNSINEFITHSFDFNDDEIVDYYISFLKSLSLRMETIPLGLFYNKKYKDFPLMSQAVKFYNHPASMVRTSVHNITLTLFQLKDPKFENYLTNFPFVNYFINLSCYMNDLWIKINEALPTSNLKNANRLQELLDDQYDILMYIEDIFKLKKEKISKILGNALLSYLIIPNLLLPLSSNIEGPLHLNLSLYFINLLFNSLTYTPILEFMFVHLFSYKLTTDLLTLKKTVPETPPSYSSNWTFKTAWDTRDDILDRKYSELIHADAEHLDEAEPDISKLHSPKENINVEEEYRNLAKHIGVIAEQSNAELTEYVMFAPLNLLEEFQKCFSNKGEIVGKASLEHNSIKSNFLNLFKSEDDNVILLVMNILESVLASPPNPDSISMKIFMICKLTFEKAPPMANKNLEISEFCAKNENTKCVLDCLYKLMNQNPPFRVTTMRLIAKLIITLSESETEKHMISQENLSMFNKGYRSSIVKLLRFLQNSTVGDLFIDLFETQWNEIYKQTPSKMNRKEYIYMLLPPINEVYPSVDKYLKIPITECELARREISMFLLFRKIRYSLIKITRFSANFTENYRPNPSKDNLSSVPDKEEVFDLRQRKTFQCKLKDPKDTIDCSVVEDNENFVVVTLDNMAVDTGKILINYKLKATETMIGRFDPCSLLITTKIKDKRFEKLLLFSDQSLCMIAKRMIDDNRRHIKRYDMTVLLKSFENAKNDIYEP